MPIYTLTVKDVMRIYPRFSYGKAYRNLRVIRDIKTKLKNGKYEVTLDDLVEFNNITPEQKEMIIKTILNS